MPLPLVIGIAAALLVFLLRWPLTTLRISLSLAILASAIALARAWSFWLPAILASPFGQADLVTGIDLSFTVLRLPAFQLVLSVLMAQALVGLSACLWLCLSQGTTLSDWRFAGFNRQQQAVLRPQLAVLAFVAALMAPWPLLNSWCKAMGWWLAPAGSICTCGCRCGCCSAWCC